MNAIICLFNKNELSFTGDDYDFSGITEIYSGDYDYVTDVTMKSTVGVSLGENLISHTAFDHQLSLASTLRENKRILNWDGYHFCFCKYVQSSASINIDVRQIIGVRIYLGARGGYIMRIPIWDSELLQLVSR